MVIRETLVVVSSMMVIMHGVTVVLAEVALPPPVAFLLAVVMAMEVEVRVVLAGPFVLLIVQTEDVTALVKLDPKAQAVARALLLRVGVVPEHPAVVRAMPLMAALLQDIMQCRFGASFANAKAVMPLEMALAVLQVTVAPVVKLKLNMVVTAVRTVMTPPPTTATFSQTQCIP